MQQVYDELIRQGASPTQAAGIVGNVQSETGGNTQYNRSDCKGIVCWTAGNFNPPSPTGNDAADLKAQVAYLIQSGGLKKATGNDPCTVAQNFGQNYERCAECHPGGKQYTQRCEQAKAFPAGGATTQPAPSGGGGSSSCFATLPVFGGCIVSKSQLKAIEAGFLVAIGGATLLVGTMLVVSWGLHDHGAGRAALASYNRLPGLPTMSQPQRRPEVTTAGFGGLDARLGRSREQGERRAQQSEDDELYGRHLAGAGERRGQRGRARHLGVVPSDEGDEAPVEQAPEPAF